jgi:hypothetical protein
VKFAARFAAPIKTTNDSVLTSDRPVTRIDSGMRNGQAQPCNGCRTKGLRLGRRVDRPTYQANIAGHPAALLGWPGKTRNKMRMMLEAERQECLH